MNLWEIQEWKEIYGNLPLRKGLRLRCEKDVAPEVKRACKEFCKWLRSNYYFPIRVPIYLKANSTIIARDGEEVSAVFFGPYDHFQEPYIKIATGDYPELLEEGKDNALAAYLCSIIHELTHYYQWINGKDMSGEEIEEQIDIYTEEILANYAETREHP